MLLNDPYLEDQQEGEAVYQWSFLAWDGMRKADWLPSHSSWQLAGCSQRSHWGECTLSQLSLLFWQPWDMLLLTVKICSPILQNPLGIAHQTGNEGAHPACIPLCQGNNQQDSCMCASSMFPDLPRNAMPFGWAVTFPFCGNTVKRNTVGTSMMFMSSPAWGSSNNSRAHLLSLRCQACHPQAKSEKKKPVKNLHEQKGYTWSYNNSQAP